MDTERNLLFGVVALQSGAVDAEGLSETCAAWAAERTSPLADLMVHRGLMTEEQRSEVEATVARELASHGDDPHATLAATLDGRSMEALATVATADDPASGSMSALAVASMPPQAPGQAGHVVLGRLSPGEPDAPRDRYTLTHLHAKGGMGRVWLARDGSLGRQIALKELRPDQSDNSIVCSRFLYEAKITAQLEHPGIVPVYELGEGDAPYYTMRFVRGRTLSEATRAYHKRRAAGEADSVGLHDLLTSFVSVCHAVAYAHSRGIIHRDLKGQNVVLGDFGEVIVLDWGLAKRVGPDPALAQAPPPAGSDPAAPAGRLDPEAATAATCAAAASDDGLTLPDGPDEATSAGSAPGAAPQPGTNGGAHPSGSGGGHVPESGAGPEGTMQGQLLGTPAYMAPEQARARHDLVDQRTDVYGLGAILYEILAGRPPFVAPKTSQVIKKVINEPPTPPRQIVPGVAPGLEAVCLKALQKSKDDRYQTASDLAAEVRRYLADEPVLAFPEPWTERARRWARRNRTKVAGAAATLVVATIVLGISTPVILQARNEAEAQGEQARQAVHLLAKGADIAFDDQLDPVQREILQDALDYYQNFTANASNQPAVQLEHGRAFQRMGDFQRKLGDLAGSEESYRRAIEKLEPLTATGGVVGRGARQAMARTRTLLGDLLSRSGGERGRAGPLYDQALEVQRVLADAGRDPAATAEDMLRLGQTEKSRGDLARLNGHWAEAATAYDRAIAELERARAVAAAPAEARGELALAIDARGWVRRERGDDAGAEQDFRRAIEQLEALVAEFPTTSRHREALARALNSLALIEQRAGRLADAEAHLRRELPLADRLHQDFPDRPEYQRVLARALMNLGIVLSEQHRLADAEPVLRRAVDLDAAIAARSPDDRQIRLDRGKTLNNLGDALRSKGDLRQALARFQEARSIDEALVKAAPDQPRYREALAGTLVNLALVFEDLEPARVEETSRAAASLYDELIRAYPENMEYRIGQARCLRNRGTVLAAARRFEPAEDAYRRALAALEAGDGRGRGPEAQRLRADVFNNRAELRRTSHRLAEAEADIRQAVAINESLAAGASPALVDRHHLAIARYNLGDLLVEARRAREAGPLLDAAEAGLERLAAGAPRSIDFHSHLAIVQATQGAVLAEAGKLPEAAAALARAIGHQERAVQLSKDRADLRARLGDHLLARADVNLRRAAYQEAAEDAVRAPRAVPEAGRAEACFRAARLLARLVARVDTEAGLVPADRDRRIRPYLARSIILLREALDGNPRLADRIKDAPEFRAIEARPEFQTMMNSLVDLGG